MLWLAVISLITSMAASLAAFLLWRRVRRLETGAVAKAQAPSAVERDVFGSVELSLAAMLEELELKEREILRRIERREAELLALVEKRGERAVSKEAAEEPQPGPAPGPSRPQPPGYAEKAAAVLRLAAEGLDDVTIAKRLGMGKGEVALILGLSKTV